MRSKIAHISIEANGGGAGISAVRLHEALIKTGFNSEFFSCSPVCLGETYKRLPKGIRLRQKMYFLFFKLLQKLCKSDVNDSINSFSLFNTGLARYLNMKGFDIVFVHWVGAELCSLKELLNLNSKVIVIAHDLWWLGGSSHVYDDIKFRGKGFFSSILTRINKNVSLLKLDFLSKNSTQIICPSEWMFKNVTATLSEFKKSARVYHIPNLVPDSYFERQTVEKNYNIALGTADVNCWHKGGDLLLPLLEKIRNNAHLNCKSISVFGNLNDSISKRLKELNCDVLGHLSNDTLNIHLERSAVYITLSRIDNLPNVVLESICLRTKVVGFNIGGNSDLIFSDELGFLVDLDDLEQLVGKIVDVFEASHLKIESQVYEQVKMKFSEKTVVNQIVELLND